ncbi:ORF_57 [Adoxophyes orana granulovirus]|uniref:ADOR56 n=1 Tax=Adoxophyes orana granulovirus TaxID=170617 RepID=Q7T9V8_GVAO|nr:ORF_57 [Adoxophyes orana granulovirus]AAP85694.1 ORF_57 [Adoxophyes orana granulovirus]AJA91696.1 ADOR56 [Adoxophyes orana granulovirus]
MTSLKDLHTAILAINSEIVALRDRLTLSTESKDQHVINNIEDFIDKESKDQEHVLDENELTLNDNL